MNSKKKKKVVKWNVPQQNKACGYDMDSLKPDTKEAAFSGLCMGGFLFPFASSAFTSPILCLAHCIVVLLVWRRAAGLAELLQKPALKAWEKAAVWLD